MVSLTAQVDDLKGTRQEDRAELVRLRADAIAQQQAALTCERTGVTLSGQAAQATDLKAQLDVTRAQLAQLNADAALAHSLSALLDQERSLDALLLKRTHDAGYDFTGPVNVRAREAGRRGARRQRIQHLD